MGLSLRPEVRDTYRGEGGVTRGADGGVPRLGLDSWGQLGCQWTLKFSVPKGGVDLDTRGWGTERVLRIRAARTDTTPPPGFRPGSASPERRRARQAQGMHSRYSHVEAVTEESVREVCPPFPVLDCQGASQASPPISLLPVGRTADRRPNHHGGVLTVLPRSAMATPCCTSGSLLQRLLPASHFQQ